MRLLSRLFGKKQEAAAGDSKPNPLRRISILKTMGEWGGLLTSKHGDTVIYLHGGTQIPAGEWLYFLYHLETQPDNRIVFSDTACFWLKIPKPFDLSGQGNMYYPIPKEIAGFISQDGSYAEWNNAFHAVDDYFSKDDGWKYQWSWKTDRVKHFMAGECSDWVSSSTRVRETQGSCS